MYKGVGSDALVKTWRLLIPPRIQSKDRTTRDIETTIKGPSHHA